MGAGAIGAKEEEEEAAAEESDAGVGDFDAGVAEISTSFRWDVSVEIGIENVDGVDEGVDVDVEDEGM